MFFKLTIEYTGTNYCGFQKQFGLQQKSVEEALEVAIHKLSQEQPKIFTAGRTDAGVHALGQVIHFNLNKKFTPYKIQMGLNNYLRDEDISVLSCEEVDENFHARFDAKMRHYRYRIINRKAPLTIEKNRAWHVAQKLDVEEMKKAAEFLIGKHDFSSFRDAECQAKSPIRTVKKITIEKFGEEILFEISARSFLHHMVRNIVGTLVWIGSGKFPAAEMKKILEARDRAKSGPNAPACGLYFLKVDY